MPVCGGEYGTVLPVFYRQGIPIRPCRLEIGSTMLGHSRGQKHLPCFRYQVAFTLSRMFKLVLWDIDGTLIRTGGAGVKAFAKAFATEFGFTDGSEKLKFAGRTDVSLVREFFVMNGVEPTPKHFQQFFAVYVRYLEEMIVNCEGEICPGISEFMSGLRASSGKPRFGLLTGNIRRGAEIKLNRFNLWHEFPFGGFADDHEDRDCIAAIAKQRGADLLNQKLRDEEVLVIGDTPHDIRCARAINAKVLAVATGGAKWDELEKHQPDWLVKDLTDGKLQQLCPR